MDQTQIKEILGKQLELLAEASESKPSNLLELSVAMCEIADRLEEVQDPISRSGYFESGMLEASAKSELGKELDEAIGPDEFKALGQDLALVIAKHKLTRNPKICEKVFRYMSFVILGWNSLCGNSERSSERG